MKLREYLFVRKESKNNDFIQRFILFRVSLRHHSREMYSLSFITLWLSHDVTWTNLIMSLLHFYAINILVMLLSMQGQKALKFHQKYLNLCSKFQGLTGLEWHEGEELMTDFRLLDGLTL